MSSGTTQLSSRIYRGTLRHRRHRPTLHSFEYSAYMLYLDLSELDEVFSDSWAWSQSRFGLLSFRRSDFLGDQATSLDEACRDLVETDCGKRPDGPIRMLTTVRSLGFGFNPITIYYCFDRDDSRVDSIVASVSNTPWHDMRNYVLGDNAAGPDKPWFRASFKKTMHVSPFNPMDMRYDWRSTTPGDSLMVHLENHKDDQRVFDATITLDAFPATSSELVRTLRRHPLMAWKNVACIHLEALKLALRRAPIYDYPHRKDHDASGALIGQKTVTYKNNNKKEEELSLEDASR